MTTNFYWAHYAARGGHPNSSPGYMLRRAPVQRGRDAIASDKKDVYYCRQQSVDPLSLRRTTAHQWLRSGVNTCNLVRSVVASGDKHCTMAAREDQKWDFFNVYLDLTERGLGMSIRGGNDSPDKFGSIDVYVSRILAGGAVHQDGRLQTGDILLEVNNIPLDNINHKSAVDSILKAAPYIHFYAKRSKVSDSDSSDIYEQIPEIKEEEPLLCNDDDNENEPFCLSRQDNLTQFNHSSNDCIKIELIRDDNGFGFSLTGGLDNQMAPGDSKIYVSKLVQNGPAHRNGLIQVGDQIVAVNDTNLERVPYNWALNLIRSSPALSIFTVRKALTWD